MTPYNFLMVQSDLLFDCVSKQTNPRFRRILAKIVAQMTSAADNTDRDGSAVFSKYLAASTLLFGNVWRARWLHRMTGSSYVMHPNVCVTIFLKDVVRDEKYMRGNYDTKPWASGERWRQAIEDQQMNLVLYCEHNRKNRFFTDHDHRLCHDLYHALVDLVNVTKSYEFCYTEIKPLCGTMAFIDCADSKKFAMKQ